MCQTLQQLPKELKKHSENIIKKIKMRKRFKNEVSCYRLKKDLQIGTQKVKWKEYKHTTIENLQTTKEESKKRNKGITK